MKSCLLFLVVALGSPSGAEEPPTAGVTKVEKDVTVPSEASAPLLNNLGHYTDWLERHPFQYIVPKERLDK